jgi:TolB-like protein/DNA-binding winged helix-turn-helix (wHTH) protein/Flp pilus assembly protein TadD
MLAPKLRYMLDDFALDPERRLLTRHGVPVHLTQKPFRVLLYLVEHRERIVSRAELLDHFWEGRDVYDDTLRKTVSAIRKALGDRGEQPKFIETVYAEGYRYIGRVEELSEGASQMTSLAPAGEDEVVEAPGSDDMVTVAPHSFPSAPRPGAAWAQPRRLWRVVVVALVTVVALVALLAWRARRTPPPERQAIRSIAVLPLKNLSGDSAHDYFSDGLTEHLINTLTRIDGLKVIARGSAFTFQGQEVDPQEAGKKLGVAAILQGSVFNRAERVRVEVRLVSAEDGRVLWASDTSDHTLGDIFALQDEIARRVVASLSIKLSAEGERRLVKRETDNVEAYQARLKGDYFRNQRTPEGLRKAIDSYQRAIAQDARYQPAYLGLASGYYMGIWYIPLEPKEATAKAKAATLKALEVDNSSSEAHVALSGLLWMDWDWAGCLREMERAKELDPGFSDYGYAYQLLLTAGRPDEAVRWITRSEELDPLSVLVSANVGEILYYARRYDEAIAQCQKTLGLDPNYAMAHTHLGLAYVQKGRHEEGIAEFEKAIALSDRSPDLLGHLGHAYAAAGQREQVQKVLAELSELTKHRYVPTYRLAEIHAALGEQDQAFAWLEEAYRAHAMHLCNLKVEPTLDPLRADPRFTNLLRRVGLAE